MKKNKYETILILSMGKKEEERQATLEKIEKLISDNGELLDVEVWGDRKLAFPIQGQNNGYYILINFISTSEFIDDLNKAYDIEETIIKHIIVKISE